MQLTGHMHPFIILAAAKKLGEYKNESEYYKS